MLKIKVFSSLVICFLAVVVIGCLPSNDNNSAKNTKSLPVITNAQISGWVVYSNLVNHEPLEQIFLRELDTGDVRQLTFSGDNSFPKWSPDGSQIIFVSHTKEKSHDIYIMNKDGSNQRPLIATTADESFPDWSPDGTKIVFTSNQDGDEQVYIMELVSKKITKLTSAPILLASLPTWSSNGKRIAFQASLPDEAMRSQIFIMNADGTNLAQITSYGVDIFDGQPVWCPDDTCIIFSRGFTPKLMVIDLATKTVEPLFKDIFEVTSMQTSVKRSPSSNFLTFVVDREFYAMDMIHKEIYPLNVVDVLCLSLNPQ